MWEPLGLWEEILSVIELLYYSQYARVAWDSGAVGIDENHSLTQADILELGKKPRSETPTHPKGIRPF